MNYTTIGIGATAVLYGLYTLTLRLSTPETFGKLEAMKKFYGRKTGVAINAVAYTIVPLAAGILFIILGIQGKALF